MISSHLKIKNSLLAITLLLVASLTTPVYAEDEHITAHSTQESFHQEWARATDKELSELRGGFVLPNGMHINMSLEKFIHLNDALVHSSSVNMPRESVLLQVGMHNLMPDSAAMPQLSTFIQNTLDSQHIEALTKINIEVSNLKGIMANSSDHHLLTNFLAPALLR